MNRYLVLGSVLGSVAASLALTVLVAATVGLARVA